jgi:6-phosphogluconolactonase
MDRFGATAVSRRAVVGGIALMGAGLTSSVGATPRRGFSMTVTAYVGCRTSRERNARGDGIGVYHIAPDGSWVQAQLVKDLLNPSFLAFDRTRRFLFTVHGDGSEASAFGIEPETGKLSFLNRVTTGGRNPVHLSVDPTNRFLVVANHIVKDGVQSGIATLPIGMDGRLGAPADIVAFDGTIGPHRVEQPFPKPHQVAFDRAGRFIVVPDKGCDRIRVFTLDDRGKLLAHSSDGAAARESSGPRHIVFHPDNAHAYALNELDSTIAVYRYDAVTGALHPFQVVPSVPDSFTGNTRASEIAISADGRFVYASNRGDDTIGIFAVEPTTSRLRPLDWVPAQGRTPRFITLSPENSALFIANEESHVIVRYNVDHVTGLLARPVTVAETGSPTCILFA